VLGSFKKLTPGPATTHFLFSGLGTVRRVPSPLCAKLSSACAADRRTLLARPCGELSRSARPVWLPGADWLLASLAAGSGAQASEATVGHWPLGLSMFLLVPCAAWLRPSLALHCAA
jgi:hypothetical protein